MQPTVTTYILFDGTCHDALKFYQSCFGGDLTLAQVKDSPIRSQMPPHLHDRVLNARLKGENVDISASDWLRPDQNPRTGNTVCLYVSCRTHSEVEEIFGKLSQGADITDPLKQMWFGSYGALNDKFGLRWMFYANAEPSAR